MALVSSIKPLTKERQSIHAPVDCTSFSFSDDGGRRYLQLDTYGSSERQLKGKVSQSLQFGEEAAAQLQRLIAETLPTLR
jgi:hypothetical protein